MIGHMQGFASGDLERDATAIRMFADDGMEMLLAQSYAKNMVPLPLFTISNAVATCSGAVPLGQAAGLQSAGVSLIFRDMQQGILVSSTWWFKLTCVLLGYEANRVILRAGPCDVVARNHCRLALMARSVLLHVLVLMRSMRVANCRGCMASAWAR